MKYILRDYQEKAVDKAVECFTSKDNGILVLPTASGKSLIVASIVERIKTKTVIFQPTKEILEQNLEKMQNIIKDEDLTISVYSASMNMKEVGDITFATIGSVKDKQDLFKNFGLIIIDECHRVNAKKSDTMYVDFIKKLGLPVIGLTATPYRLMSYRDMRSGENIAENRILTRTRPRVFNKIKYVVQIKDLLGKYISHLDYDYQNDYDSRKIKSNSTGQGYDENELKSYNNRYGIVSKTIDVIARARYKHCLAFTMFVDEAEEIRDRLGRYGITAEVVSAKLDKKTREEIILAFKEGRIKCVLNVGTLTTGFDFPSLDCLVISRPTKSLSLYYQMIGRGLRKAEGKENCKIFDLCDNVKRFGKIETFELVDVSNGKGIWRLKSDTGFLTGVDINTGKDLEARERRVSDNDIQKVYKKTFIIPFGKHKGKLLAEIDEGYIKWVVENFDNKYYKKIFSIELERRQMMTL